MKPILLILTITLALAGCKQSSTEPVTYTETKGNLPPDERFGQLFADVQLAGIFPDGKTFPDCSPRFPTDEILAKYEAEKVKKGFSLEKFVKENFDLPQVFASGYQSDTSQSAEEHINDLWPVLTRQPDNTGTGSLIPLPYPYIVPGGRFGEIYYWDSYFTMLGLQVAGKVDMIQNMINNFAYLIDTIGFIPNGNRTYFLSRSQPPFFSMMVGLLAESKGDSILVRYLPQMEKEYRFWMNGEKEVTPQQPAIRHVVRLPNGVRLNRYWDERAAPRAEMYRADVETASAAGKPDAGATSAARRPEAEVYRHLKSACESGWDFSSRWFTDPEDLSTIRTADLIPVDLNALMYNLEQTIAKAYRVKGQSDQAQRYAGLALQRKKALLSICWDASRQFFFDYNFRTQQTTGIPTLAGVFPLYLQMATPQQAMDVARTIERDFLKPGGVVTTLNRTGQQWDAPNGWAPLQWATIQGLRNYNHTDLANEVKRRWVDLNLKVYRSTGKMLEKYNVMDLSLKAGGGEYPVQDGFGWTNGVLLKLLKEE